MSNNLNMATVHGADVEAVSSPSNRGAMGVAGRWLSAQVAGWREAMALRRSLHEISQLSERELADIGLAQDEIVRLKSNEYFTPRSWRVQPVSRSDLPF